MVIVMDPFEKIRGGYEVGKERLIRKRDMIIQLAKEFVPENLTEVLAVADGVETDYPLKWVRVPDPLYDNGTLEVLPSLYLWKGDEENQPDVYEVTISVMAEDEELPLFRISNYSRYDSSCVSRHGIGELPWDSSDTELLLNIAESALLAQS